MTTKIKIGIVGSRTYTNKKKVKDLVFEIKQKYGAEVEIVSGGQKLGADGYAKKYALELGLQYEEYPPAHQPHNLYCPLHERNYGKPFSVKNFFARNKQIAIHSEYVVAFIPRGIDSPGSMSTIGYAKKFGKKTLVIN